MPDDRSRGLYKKYFIQRYGDVKNKHKNCFYFVLDPIHDEYAREAIAAYGVACAKEYPNLAKDLATLLDNTVDRYLKSRAEKRSDDFGMG